MDSTSNATNYAVVRIGGKQYRVSPGSKVSVTGFHAEKGSAVSFSDVLAVCPDGGQIKTGTPLVAGAAVKAKVLRTFRAPKVVIYKKKPSRGYTKKQGHRQGVTELMIESI